mmetsp:Transcript_13691/g.20185  ORF Transcript_13691/g.20185 Transcript_13691/m.20185 type:complete len:171 (+) Transcript_13691:221-733(+)|eukprot:CAMPEP_0194214370 /NCGR_PEP_ID=MMETSP0156-20130528/15514_1 /TAXON_ID=33649 /ORGANISM="Thalassionema nitzschioides, Strain L26-B" /LENGTH=170 /DNA_ID=CAMNT_0038942603 /DNA_START=148 /DNA_END=663 /DNA_ORIENTATION=-
MQLQISNEPRLLTEDDSISSAEFEVCKRKPLNQKISFSKEVRVHEVLHVDDMTDDEVTATWYERQEMIDIKMTMFRELSDMLKGRVNEEEFTFRGLEYRIKEGNDKRRENKFNAIDAILDEQEHQFNDGVDNPEKISECYQKQTKQCKIDAQSLAKNDEREVQFLWNTPI